MVKFWRVARQEYARHVLRRRFLFGLLSLPAIIALMVVVTILLIRTETDERPIGYIDLSGLLDHPTAQPKPDAPLSFLAMVRYADEQSARAGLQAGDIQAYFILSPDYRQDRQVRLVSTQSPNQEALHQIESFLRANWLAGQPEAVIQRISEGSNWAVRSVDGRQRLRQGDWMSMLVPFFTGLIFVVAMFTTSGYLVQAVAEEKENRTMEMLVTSVSPGQLMAGKTTGILLVGATQLGIWTAFSAGAIWLARSSTGWLRNFQPSLDLVLISVLMFLPAFTLFAALMVAIGATVADVREGQQITGIFTIPVFMPYWLTVNLMSYPNGPLAVGMSLFPLTAPVAMSLRAGFTQVPAWQIALSLALLTLSAAFSVWLAGRAFRLGMLRYGQRLTWREILGKQARESA